VSIRRNGWSEDTLSLTIPLRTVMP